MTPLMFLALSVLVLAAIPACMTVFNLLLYRPPRRIPESALVDRRRREAVSVLIPARDEQDTIGRSVEAALAAEQIDVEVIVLDDHSTDATVGIVSDLARRDNRVRLDHAPALPEGWCGKQHACYQLAQLARHDTLMFIDADVTLTPDGPRATVDALTDSGAALVSGIPHQQTRTLLEKMLIPLIHFVLLGYLPMVWMRASSQPSYGAGCGQLFVADRDAYFKMGGHAEIKASLHDGIRLPRAYRSAGFMTDLFDATGVATCRMYRGAGQVWSGLAKNATEGMASPKAILPWTVLLLGGQTMPLVLLALGFALHWSTPMLLVSAAALGLSYLPRLLAAERFDQSKTGALLHPLGVAVLVAIQWYALTRRLAGYQSTWRGRAYAAE